MTGRQIKAILEQGVSLERGLIQVSGIKAVYDLSKPINDRVISLEIEGNPVEMSRNYSVATQSFLSQGGDLYDTFLEVSYQDSKINLSDVVINFIKEKKEINLPKMGRLVSVVEKKRRNIEE